MTFEVQQVTFPGTAAIFSEIPAALFCRTGDLDILLISGLGAIPASSYQSSCTAALRTVRLGRVPVLEKLSAFRGFEY